MRVVSWNVNGLRSCGAKGFVPWLEAAQAYLVGVQEVRARHEQLPGPLRSPAGWHVAVQSAERPGYSGVALYARRAPDDLTTTLGEPRFDLEGRLQVARFGRLVVANVYFPNGNGTGRDNGRIP